MRGAGVLATAVILAGCGGGDVRTAAQPGDSALVSVDAGTPHGRVALELWPLRAGVTAAEWLQQHPEDEVRAWGEEPAPAAWGSWCLRAVQTVVADSVPLRRTAFFYVPTPPADLALPDSATTTLALRCELGLIGVELAVADAAAGAALADTLRALLGRVYGGVTADAPLTFWGSGFWTRTGRYAAGTVTAVSALAQPPRPPGDSARAGVLAFAFLPLSGLSLTGAPALAEDPVRDAVPFDSVLALAGLDTARAAALRRVLAAADEVRTDAALPLEVRSLLTALVPWLDAAAALPPPRRAAALYAADVVLDRSLCHFGGCNDRAEDSVALAPLRARGAGFVWPELGMQWIYTHDWLNQARLFDRDSPLGDRIFLTQLLHAFDFSGMCLRGMDGFERVISNAERYLERLPAGPISAEVHLLAGDAWADIVSLAEGAAGDLADTSRYAPRAAEARRRAVAHYRAALAAGPAAPVAQAAWRRAWQLMAGLRGRPVRFYCVYD